MIHPIQQVRGSALSIPANTSEEVEQTVAALQRGNKLGPVIFANRYDGIDLPGDACRVLVLSGVPSGTSDYDKYRGAVLTGAAINTTLAQRIEQGIGRGARGAGDYCVVILDGHSLVAWLGRENNTNYLTAATKQQIQIGKMVSSAVNSEKDFLDTVDKCLLQDASWKGFYAMQMAEAAVLGTPEELPIKIATAERKSFDLWRQARHHLARAALDSVMGEVPDKSQQGWLLQQTARIVHSENNVPEAQKIQVRAHTLNRQLSRSRISPPYSLLPEPSEQSKEVWRRLRDYGNPYGYIAYFNERVAAFTTVSSSNQFEEAIKELGNFLGFGSERPEAETGKGPDVLWRTATSEDFVIEAKSDKDPKNPLKKSEHGQLLVSVAWYKANYKDKKCIGLVVHPNALATDNAGATDALALTLDTLNSLVSDLRKALQELADSGKIGGTAEQLCAELLNRHGLDPDGIKKRLQLFKVAKS